ncbi:MAG: DUF2304 domain-containing protein [Eubacteriales bacterium]|nr:DUF2304 domain-containing protein [Eubacteriales bacterium]
MSEILRFLLFFAALATGGWILFKIRKLQIKMQDAIFWVVFAVILFVLGIFPEICYWLTDRLGIMSPANLIFLVVIFLLMEKIFTLSIIVSQLEEKVSVLSAELALRSNASKKRLDDNEKAIGEIREEIRDQKDEEKNVPLE